MMSGKDRWNKNVLRCRRNECIDWADVTLLSSSSSSSTNFIATQVLNKTSGPLCVTYYTTAVMSMLLWPIVCVAVWSAEQFHLQCTLECPQRRQRRDRRRQCIPNLCRGNGEGAIADGPVQRPWNLQRRWRCRSQTPTCNVERNFSVCSEWPGITARLILRTLGPFNVYILLNGWICLHCVLG